MQDNVITLMVKLASIAVHADEVISPGAREFDKIALRQLLKDPEVVVWLEKMTEQGLAPVKR